MGPYLVAVTGRIGAGKSTVSAELAARGAQVIAGDELGRRALDESPSLIRDLQRRFGVDILAEDGSLRRRLLGQRVFADPSHVRWLTAATFPLIHTHWREAVSRASGEVLVFDAALIFEWGIEREFDLVVIVLASKEQVMQRQSSHRRFTPEEMTSRMAAQVDPTRRADAAHVVLQNDGSLDELRRQVENLWTQRIEPELTRRRKERNAEHH